MRKALIVGIDYYKNINHLSGCVTDALSVQTSLERNFDDSKNFGVRLIVSRNEQEIVRRRDLRSAISELFQGKPDIALFILLGMDISMKQEVTFVQGIVKLATMV
ncbi:hypothetical protein BBW68_03035 [Candidatus Erwinia dacicola]|uniref:Peptidase C14 caspase domain-containing protein n=1 Tax=Candidatus Erwinia dacicola TaxID=252393 RepID=A0A1E7YUN8_9GAMM|nr:caspase family protein [Candidatus Erwinia dacicola]OFC58385.1 hypothetical protein BBW68_03035 [Candidatus Erwinia dacicola]